MMIRCTRCSTVKPETEFARDRTHANGHAAQCKTCRNGARITPGPFACAHCPSTFSSRRARGHHETDTHPGTRVSDSVLRDRLVEQLWSGVTKTPTCWLFAQASYGKLGLQDARLAAHRFSFELAYGPIPAGLEVCHRCDEPRCVRPDHLFLGTRAENMADMAAKGRGQNPAARLTPADVAQIRASRETAHVLAARYAVTANNIRVVRRRASWKSVA